MTTSYNTKDIRDYLDRKIPGIQTPKKQNKKSK